MTKTQAENCVITDRGGIVENRHNVHVAVVDRHGKLLFSVGDASRITLVRSAAKPAQALAVLETGGFKQAGFDDADLALMCASHNSEERHLERAREMLKKTGAQESDLRCGGHPSINEAVNKAWIKQDIVPTALYNNCSGKHAGMLAGAQALGAGFADYHLLSHPLQQRVKAVHEDLCELEGKEIGWAIDGCNAPAPAFPLLYLGKMYARFAQAADALSRGAENVISERTRNMARIFNAMTTYPENVAGEDRFCTTLMDAFEGTLIGKVGADGCYGVGIRASEQTRRLGADTAVGISVKIEDGSLEILYAVVSEVLEQLNIGTEGMRRKLAPFHHLQRLNTMGVVTGNVSMAFKVQRV